MDHSKCKHSVIKLLHPCLGDLLITNNSLEWRWVTILSSLWQNPERNNLVCSCQSECRTHFKGGKIDFDSWFQSLRVESILLRLYEGKRDMPAQSCSPHWSLETGNREEQRKDFYSSIELRGTSPQFSSSILGPLWQNCHETVNQCTDPLVTSQASGFNLLITGTKS